MHSSRKTSKASLKPHALAPPGAALPAGHSQAHAAPSSCGIQRRRTETKERRTSPPGQLRAHLDHQVAVVGGHALHVAGQRVGGGGARQLLKLHVVAQVDYVEEGGEVVVAVLAAAHDPQEEVDLEGRKEGAGEREGGDKHRELGRAAEGGDHEKVGEGTRGRNAGVCENWERQAAAAKPPTGVMFDFRGECSGLAAHLGWREELQGAAAVAGRGCGAHGLAAAGGCCCSARWAALPTGTL
jgi:hypothetical protein